MKITIIIPAYNATDTLEETLKSALTSFADQEIIVINDGSTDNTGEIADKYAEKYKNLKVLHTENGGVSRARNLGIEKATGDYILFMDADDRIVYDGELELDSYLEESDLFLFSFNEKKMNGKLLKSFVFEERFIKKNDIPMTFLESKYSFYGPWAKIYKKEIILQNNIRFNVGQKYGEDAIFVLNYLSCISNGIYLSSKILYSHYINPEGASYYNKYYIDMNVYLYNQFKAFKTLVFTLGMKNQEMIEDFACSLFCETILHYYQRTRKTEFFKKFLETQKMYTPYLTTGCLKKYPLFKFLDNSKEELADPNIIDSVYKKNWIFKLKFRCKKIIYRFL